MMCKGVTWPLWTRSSQLVLGLMLIAACGDEEADKEQTSNADASMSATVDGGPATGANDGGASSTGDSGAAGPLLSAGKAGAACTAAAACGPTARCADKLTFGALSPLFTAVPTPGGYCSADCTMNEQCASGGVCFGSVLGRTGECRSACTASSDCRQGFECAQSPAAATGAARLPASCQPSPTADKLTANQAGKACASDGDCGDGRCVDAPDNNFGAGKYCTGTCLADADCGEGGLCIVGGYGSAGVCRETCAQKSDCQGSAAGWGCGTVSGKPACVPKGEPLATGIVGKACTMATQATDCGSGTCRMQAFGTTYPGGYCVGGCSSDADCGAEGVCINATTCLLKCNAAASSCRTGYSCVKHPMAPMEQTQTICYPTLTGDAGVASDAGP